MPEKGVEPSHPNFFATCSDALMDFRSSLKEANELLVQEYSQSVAAGWTPHPSR
jgi:hypothetical protein